MEDLIGKMFGAYEIVSLLGEGGMAAVYKARQPAMDRYVAVKILPQRLAQDAEFLARFEREARILAQLQHPHILPVFDYGNANGYPYLVMPMLSGGTLSDTFDKNPQPMNLIRQRISQIGDALDYAHEHGLVHRDVKPSNILLDERNNCLLSDFGLAKVLESANKITASGGIVGTPFYMSPEQAVGNPLDQRTDIYSLGVVLYEMATGRVPFSADTPIAVVLKHIQEALPSPRAINPDIPYNLELVILKALEKDPAKRYASAGEMVAALRSAIPEKTLILPEVEVRAALPTMVQPPIEEPQPVIVEAAAPAKSQPTPAPAKSQPQISNSNAAISDLATAFLPAIGWGLGAYIGILLSAQKTLDGNFTVLALAGALGGALLGFGMALRSHPFRWWWALILSAAWASISVEAFNPWAGLGALFLAAVITSLAAKNFEAGLSSENSKEIVSGWVLSGAATWSMYLIFQSYSAVPFQAVHAGILGILIGGVGGYYTSVPMKAARTEREARKASAQPTSPIWNFGYRLALALVILVIGYRGTRLILPESDCNLGLNVWTTPNMVEWKNQTNEFKSQNGQIPKIVAVIENTRFWRTSCGTTFGYPVKVVVTPAGENNELLNIPCPIYSDHAACILYDPTDKANTFHFPKGSYELRLMYGDVTVPVKVFAFSVAP